MPKTVADGQHLGVSPVSSAKKKREQALLESFCTIELVGNRTRAGNLQCRGFVFERHSCHLQQVVCGIAHFSQAEDAHWWWLEQVSSCCRKDPIKLTARWQRGKDL